MKLVLVCSMLMSATAFAGDINFSSSADLSSSTYAIKLVDAEYKMIPTKTEERDIPGCNPNGEASQVCTETVVLESAPAVAVNVSYQDRMFQQEGNESQWLTLLLDPATLPAADVAALKAKSPLWQHPFSNEGRNFARKVLKLTVAREARTIQVVDVRNSHLCPILESGDTYPGCVETIVYKPAQTTVNAVSVSLK